MTASGTIVISRDRDPSFSARAFNIKIDGVVAGKVKLGATVEFPVRPGLHRVQMTVDWYACEPLEIEVPDGWRRDLIAGIGPFFHAFFRPRRYLRLQVASAR